VFVEGAAMTTVLAVYEGGVLRPFEPLTLPEGQTVQLTVYPRPPLFAIRPPTPEEADYARRLEAAKTLEEIFTVMATAPPFPDGYDLGNALNANRKATAERLPFPELNNRANP
jgi:predicted DNA-binding antitoxin AbrB/MazE fold protein